MKLWNFFTRLYTRHAIFFRYVELGSLTSVRDEIAGYRNAAVRGNSNIEFMYLIFTRDLVYRVDRVF